MRYFRESIRQMVKLNWISSFGTLAVLLLASFPGQALALGAGETCNSKLQYQVTGPSGRWFVGDELTVKASLGAGSITGGEFLEIPDFGFAGDCQQRNGLTYHNCQAPNPANEIQYTGGIEVVQNCVNGNGETITFPSPQSSFIDFIPLNGPIRIPEDQYCIVSWKFKVVGLGGDAPNATLYQALSFPVIDPENDPAVCNNDRTTSNDRSGAIVIDSCSIDVQKQICDPVATDCSNDANWYDADTPEAALALTSGTAVYRAIVSNDGSAPYVDDISIVDKALNTAIDPLEPGQSMIVGGPGQGSPWSENCVGNSYVSNEIFVAASCRGGDSPITANADNQAWGVCGSSPPPLSTARIRIEKATNGQDADTAPGPTILVGEPVTWSYVVQNTGDVTITGITASDNLEGEIICPQSSLAPNASMTCTAKQGQAESGQYENVASVSGTSTSGPVSDTDPSHYFGEIEVRDGGTILLNKTADQPYFEAAGEEVGYTFVVANPGDVELTSVTVTDPKIASINCDWENSTDGSTGEGVLSPGETVTCTGTYTIQPADVTAQKVDNTATASGKDPNNQDVTDEDDETITLRAIKLTAAAECTNDVPWVSYTVDLTGFPDASPTDVSYEWVNVADGPPTTVASGNLDSLSGYMLWPGASATGVYPTAVGTAWPGWTFNAGVWSFTDTNEVPDLVLKVSINPTDEVPLSYPEQAHPCAPPSSLDITKTVEKVMDNDDGTIDVTYKVSVVNNGGQTKVYSLKDYLKVDDALVVDDTVDPVIVTYVPGNVDSMLGTIGIPGPTDFESPPGAVLVTDEEIEPGNNEGFEFTLTFLIDDTATTVAGSMCIPDGDGYEKSGTTNHVDLYVDGEFVDDAEACDEFPLHPGIKIEKFISLDNSDYDPNQAGPVEPPSGAYYKLKVTNTGDIDLYEVQVTDSLIPGETYVFGPLAAGASEFISVDGGPDGAWTSLHVDPVCETAADKDNVGYAKGFWDTEANPVMSDNSATLMCEGIPQLDIEKQVRVGEDPMWHNADDPPTHPYPTAVFDPEAPVTAEYRIILKNMGTADLVGVLFSDLLPGLIDIPETAIADVPAKGEVVIDSGDFAQLTQTDICKGTGLVTNVAGVKATSVDEMTDSATVLCLGKPDIEVVKQVSSTGDADDWHDSVSKLAIADAFWRITVTNTGSADLVNVTVEDSDDNGQIFSQLVGNLDVGETRTLVHGTPGVDEIQRSELSAPGFCDSSFTYVNTAKATGDPADGGASVNDSDTATYVCEIVPPKDLCEDGKPTWIKFRYMGNSNTFIQDPATTPVIDPPNAVFPNGRVYLYVFDDNGNKRDLISGGLISYNPGPFSEVEPDDTVTFTGTGNDGKVPPTTQVEIYGDCPVLDTGNCANTLIQVIEFHTSCSQPLHAGDQYGAIKLISSG